MVTSQVSGKPPTSNDSELYLEITLTFVSVLELESAAVKLVSLKFTMKYARHDNKKAKIIAYVFVKNNLSTNEDVHLKNLIIVSSNDSRVPLLAFLRAIFFASFNLS